MDVVKGVEKRLEGSQVQLASSVSELKQQLQKVNHLFLLSYVRELLVKGNKIDIKECPLRCLSLKESQKV